MSNITDLEAKNINTKHIAPNQKRVWFNKGEKMIVACLLMMALDSVTVLVCKNLSVLVAMGALSVAAGTLAVVLMGRARNTPFKGA